MDPKPLTSNYPTEIIGIEDSNNTLELHMLTGSDEEDEDVVEIG